MNARETAVELLLRIETGGAYLDRLLSASAFRALDARDRAFCREMISGVERWKLRLDRTIDLYYTKTAAALSPEIRTVLRLGLYQMMFMDSVPDRAAVSESVSLATRRQGKGAGGLVNAILRRFTREGEPEFRAAEPARLLSEQYAYPRWLAERWLAHFGMGDAGAIMDAGNGRHPVFIRANILKTTPEALVGSLAGCGFLASVVEKMTDYLALESAEGLFETPLFLEGLFTAQDPSAGMATILLDPQPGERVLDLCAAPGGKATHIAERMGDTGRVVAVDVHAGRLLLVKKAAERLGLRSVEIVEGDALTFSGESFDRVLLDAPCMGTAVFAKRPDMKWRRREDDIGRLASLQRKMLDHAVSLVKPGGTLVYSTCSLEPEENTEQVLGFLRENETFTLGSDSRFEQFRVNGGMLILPHQMQGTGGFSAQMKRV